MIALPITSAFTALFALALVTLSVPVTLRRLKVGDMVGDSSDAALRRRIRAQGNFIEYVPLALVALALLEVQAVRAGPLIAIGAALILGRLLHAIGMYCAYAPLRGFGMVLTYLALIGAAAGLARQACSG